MCIFPWQNMSSCECIRTFSGWGWLVECTQRGRWDMTVSNLCQCLFNMRMIFSSLWLSSLISLNFKRDFTHYSLFIGLAACVKICSKAPFVAPEGAAQSLLKKLRSFKLYQVMSLESASVGVEDKTNLEMKIWNQIWIKLSCIIGNIRARFWQERRIHAI